MELYRLTLGRRSQPITCYMSSHLWDYYRLNDPLKNDKRIYGPDPNEMPKQKQIDVAIGIWSGSKKKVLGPTFRICGTYRQN